MNKYKYILSTFKMVIDSLLFYDLIYPVYLIIKFIHLIKIID